MSGLHLGGGLRRIDVAAIITEAKTGLSDGSLRRLRASARGIVHEAMESTDESASPSGGRWLRYGIDTIPDGVYVASSVGEVGEATETFFTVEEGEVRRVFDADRRRAEREAKRWR